MSTLALQISNTVTKLQNELKCGICRSTFKDPVLATCHHSFCRECLDACFARKRKVECPICRSTLDKRSCRDSFQLTHAVQYYLKLSEAFKQDIENVKTFKTLPPEKAFLESQMPLDVTVIPENDGKRCAPDFAVPLMPARRKKSKSSEPSTSDAPSTDFTVFAAPKLPPPRKPEPPKEKLKTDIGTITDPLKIQSVELQNIDIQEHIDSVCHQNNTIDSEIDALFELMPSIRTFLQKNATKLISKLGVTEVVPERRKSDKRVSFANSQELEEYRYPEPTQSSENVLEEMPEEVAPVVRLRKPVVGDDEDEVVEDSEPEDEDTQEMEKDDGMDYQEAPLQEKEKPEDTVKSAADLLDEELSRIPITVTCSRIHNDEDEVELLSDFYNKFLSNACRFTEKVTCHTTHLVMMNSDDRVISQMSIGYVQAIARKCIIVGRQWFVDCIQAGVLLPEDNYTITECRASIPTRVSSSEIGWVRSRKDKHGKLFEGCRFMILRKFSRSKVFDYRDLIELVQICGGEILSNYENQDPKKLYIVFSQFSEAIAEARNMKDMYKCEVVTMEWVLNSISEYSILPTDAYQAVDLIRED